MIFTFIDFSVVVHKSSTSLRVISFFHLTFFFKCCPSWAVNIPFLFFCATLYFPFPFNVPLCSSELLYWWSGKTHKFSERKKNCRCPQMNSILLKNADFFFSHKENKTILWFAKYMALTFVFATGVSYKCLSLSRSSKVWDKKCHPE